MLGLGVPGLVGSVACSAAMVASALGLVGAVAAGAGRLGDMAGMSGTASSTGPVETVVGFLISAGPLILALSLAAIALASALQRPRSLALVVAAGAVLYWGMYIQSERALMLAAIGTGLVLVAVALGLALRRTTRPTRRAR